MSEYERGTRGDLLDNGQVFEAIFHHRGDLAEYRKQLGRLLGKAVAQRLRAGVAYHALAPNLLRLISDERNLVEAWRYLARCGGPAPGHDGRRYRDYSKPEVWSLCRALRDAIKSEIYGPGKRRIVQIEKPGSRDKRPITLLTIFDRVVQRAVVQILQPLVDPLFEANSFAYRPRRGTQHAIALASHLTEKLARRVWVIHDVRDAFGHVSLPRLFDLVRREFPDDALLGFLRLVVTSPNTSGLVQGGPLSPLLMNWYLDHFLDKPWRKLHATTQLIRYADDLLLACRDRAEAMSADAELRRLLHPTGMSLKAETHEAVFDLDGGRKPTYLGLNISLMDGHLSFSVARRAWQRLRRRLALAHTQEHSPLRAEQVVLCWLRAHAATYMGDAPEAVIRKVLRIARDLDFDELPESGELIRRWQLDYARWCKSQKSILDSQDDEFFPDINARCEVRQGRVVEVSSPH